MMTLVLWLSLLVSDHCSDDLRDLYIKASLDKEYSQTFFDAVEDQACDEGAYHAGFYFLKAKYLLNPYSKLKNFNKGKEKLEKMIENSPRDIELRYLRHSVQTHSPSFLGYNDQVQEDLQFIIEHLSQADENVRKMISDYLKSLESND